MKVSCLCPTFARVHLLEEAVQCFLDQDYPDRELIILNDFHAQTIVFDHPLVKVINTKERYPTLGDKRNATAELASGDALVTWDDDDIFLPNRLTRLTAAIHEGIKIVYEGPFCTLHKEYVEYVDSRPHYGAWLMDLAAFRLVGGAPPFNIGEDVKTIERVLSRFGHGSLTSAKGPPAYIYRWSSIPNMHISWHTVDQTLACAKLLADAHKRLSAGDEPAGTYNLLPRLKQNYANLIRGAVMAGQAASQVR